jgi:uncharacterized protein YbcC (UPF0753/DUF2309 family)
VDIAELVAHAAHYLPAQGPIGVFIHHNTLHAFEDEPFEQAVAEAADRFGCEPFLAENEYHEALRRGRITERDVDAVLDVELGERANETVARDLTRRELYRRVLLHGLREARGAPLDWLLLETDALQRFREDLRGRDLMGREEERHRVRELWDACSAAADLMPLETRNERRRVRYRDLLLAVSNIDTDEWTRSLQIRFISAYVDQGFAPWPMPERDRGIYAAFMTLYRRKETRACGEWARHLVTMLDDDERAQRDGSASLGHSLEELGVPHEEREAFLVGEALWLRGWAGMVRQLETRPDRAPTFALPATLVDYLAVQLLLSRAALTHAMERAGIAGPLSHLGELAWLPETGATKVERTWSLFQLAQVCDLPAARVSALSRDEALTLSMCMTALDGRSRRRLLHVAYERHLRHRFYDAIVQLPLAEDSPMPTFQALFCLDEREESIRRHLEEVDPGVETFATGGFYGVAMYYRGAHAARARPLCPVAITPEHYVTEVDDRPRGLRHRLAARIDQSVHSGSRTFWRGAVITAVLGALWVIPLVLRVVFPWSRRLRGALFRGADGTRLELDRKGGAPPLGRTIGFTVDEMAAIVRGQLEPIGILQHMAPLVFVFGHGSTSLNNPQESAHDCGACGGGRGGPSARAFARMANDPRVRERLAEEGVRNVVRGWPTQHGKQRHRALRRGARSTAAARAARARVNVDRHCAPS